MKFKHIDGVQNIILEEDDKISITTYDSNGDMSINVECQNAGLDITGNSSLINYIKGDGMLEKVYIEPTLSSEEIIEQCDAWIEMFKKVHDIFKDLVKTDEYRKQDITLDVSFPYYVTCGDSGENINVRMIRINLRNIGTVLEEGLTIAVDEQNADVYKYLLSNVLDYYLSVNYNNKIIEDRDPSWNRILYSDIEKEEGSTVPIICGLSNLYDVNDYARLVSRIIANHNLKQLFGSIVNSLKMNIDDQQLSDRFHKSMERSSKQYDSIIANYTNSSTKVKKLN